MERLSELTDSIRTQPRGADFSKFCWTLLHCRGDSFKAEAVSARFAQVAPAVPRLCKAAISAIGTTSGGFSDDSTWRSVSREFISLVSARTVFGKLQDRMRRTAFAKKTLVQLVPVDATWVGEAKPKPMSSLALDTVTVPISKVVALCVFSQELTESWSQAAEKNISDAIVATVSQFTDRAFLNPTQAAVVGTNPASVTYGITGTASSGSTAAQVSSDLRAALNRLIGMGSDLADVVIILHPQTAVFMSGLLTSGGALAFPQLGANGGQVWGLSAMTTRAAGDFGSPSERVIILLDPTKILYADDGKTQIDGSHEASLQFVNDPTTGATALVSLWQNDLNALRVERFIGWVRASDSAVEIISGVQY